MSAVEDRNLFEAAESAETVLVAADTGLVAVAVAGDRVGSFGIVDRRTAVDVTVDGEDIVVATEDDVVIGDLDAFETTGFGPGERVGATTNILAADPDGRVGELIDTGWRTLGTTQGVRAIANGFLATVDGIHRSRPDLPNVGLADAHDVTATPVPRAATGDGIYRLGNGWMAERGGQATVVAGDVDGDRLYAVIDDVLHRRVDERWRPTPADVPGSVVDLAFGAAAYAVTENGVLLADAGDGWRHQSLGVGTVGGLAVLSE